MFGECVEKTPASWGITNIVLFFYTEFKGVVSKGYAIFCITIFGTLISKKILICIGYTYAKRISDVKNTLCYSFSFVKSR